MEFASDNWGPALPQVMAALTAADAGYAPAYGTDPLTDAVIARIREIFEAPEAEVLLIATGTAANALALATLTRPWQRIFCTPLAHIEVDECNAPEVMTGGAKLTLVGQADKMTPAELDAAMSSAGQSAPHTPLAGTLALTQATELGQVYTPAELAALTAVARRHGQPSYMDGARLANALAHLGCTPAEMTWKAGLDAVSLGGTKNGCLGVEALIFFDPAHGWEAQLRRKQSAHLFSKMRYLAAQMQGYLSDDTWLTAAARANASTRRLAEGLRALPGAEIVNTVEANMIFLRLPRAAHQQLLGAGARYHVMDGPAETGDPAAALTARLVCDWSLPEARIDRFLELAAAALEPET